MPSEWPSGYGPPPEPPPRDYTGDDRLRTRFEACRSGMQELDALRIKHTLLIQNLRSRLPVIPGCLDDVQTREKKSRDVFLDRFSLQSVDSGVSSQNTINSTRSSSPEDFHSSKHGNQRYSNIYENSTMNYSTFRKLSLESNPKPFVPPVTVSRGCLRGAWKSSPKKIRPKSMFETPTPSTPSEHPTPGPPIDFSRNRASAFSVVKPSPLKRHSMITASLSQLSITDRAQKPQVVRCNKIEKADTMFRANIVYVSPPAPPSTNSTSSLRFSPSRSPPVKRVQLVEGAVAHYATPCNVRSPNMPGKNVFAARPIAVRPSCSPKMVHTSTWLQSQPL